MECLVDAALVVVAMVVPLQRMNFFQKLVHVNFSHIS
jgi:hypothetical protein